MLHPTVTQFATLERRARERAHVEESTRLRRAANARRRLLLRPVRAPRCA